MAARLLAPAVRAAMPRVAASTRAMATKVEDVKLKDLPAYAQQVMKDPKTRTALEEARFQYWNTYVKTGTATPIFHVIGIMMACGYSIDYYFHLRHEANYKYH